VFCFRRGGDPRISGGFHPPPSLFRMLIHRSQIMQDQKLTYQAWGKCTNIPSQKTLVKAEQAMRSILNKSFSLPDSRVQYHLDVVDSMYMDKTVVPVRIGPSSMARTVSDQSDLTGC
jgi:hypothetical protein